MDVSGVREKILRSRTMSRSRSEASIASRSSSSSSTRSFSLSEASFNVGIHSSAMCKLVSTAASGLLIS